MSCLTILLHTRSCLCPPFKVSRPLSLHPSAELPNRWNQLLRQLCSPNPQCSELNTVSAFPTRQPMGLVYVYRSILVLGLWARFVRVFCFGMRIIWPAVQAKLCVDFCTDFFDGDRILRKSAAKSARKFASNSARQPGRAMQRNLRKIRCPDSQP